MPRPLTLSRDEWKDIAKAVNLAISELDMRTDAAAVHILQGVHDTLGADGAKAADLGVSPCPMDLFRCPSCQGTDFTAHYMIPAQQRSVLARTDQGLPLPIDALGGEESLGEPGPDDFYICRGCSAEISPDGTVISGTSTDPDDDDLPL